MKLFGKFQEYSINDIYLYATPSHTIRNIIKEHPEFEKVVKEFKPRTKVLDKEHETVTIHPDLTRRHQIVLKQNFGFMKISIYSTPMSHSELKQLGLKPLEPVQKKERTRESLEKMDIKLERGFHVEREYKKGNKKANKSDIVTVSGLTQNSWKTACLE